MAFYQSSLSRGKALEITGNWITGNLDHKAAKSLGTVSFVQLDYGELYSRGTGPRGTGPR